MAIGGLVLSLSSDPALRRSAEALIQMDPRLERGPHEGLRLAVVADTESLGEGHALCEALLAHPGIENVEVAYVAPEDDRAAEDDAPTESDAALTRAEGDE